MHPRGARAITLISIAKRRIFIENDIFLKFFRFFSKKHLTNAKIYAIIYKRLTNGGIPERPKGADCKSVVTDFAGPNPASPTKKTFAFASVFLFL